MQCSLLRTCVVFIAVIAFAEASEFPTDEPIYSYAQEIRKSSKKLS